MQHWARDHVPLVAGLFAAVSLTLVFGAVLGAIPTSILPQIPGLLDAIPHLNAALSAAAILVIASAWRAIRRGDVRTHRRGMLSGLGLFGTFLALYLYRVALRGPTPFEGPAWVETFVYLPLLSVHVILAIVCVPLLYYVLLLAVTRPVAAIPQTRHPTLGQLTASLWLVSFALGICVYLLLYWVP